MTNKEDLTKEYLQNIVKAYGEEALPSVKEEIVKYGLIIRKEEDERVILYFYENGFYGAINKRRKKWRENDRPTIN